MWLAWNSNQCLFPADIERALHEVIPEQVSCSNANGKVQNTLSPLSPMLEQSTQAPNLGQ